MSPPPTAGPAMLPAGDTTPYPIAIMKAAKTSTRTSRGSRFRMPGIVLPGPAMVQ